MAKLTVRSGKHISTDVGLSDAFTVQAVDDAGNSVLFDFDPREWLAEWELLRQANLPAGASYSRLLTICASPFDVRFLANASGGRFWEFTVFDIPTRTDRKITEWLMSAFHP